MHSPPLRGNPRNSSQNLLRPGAPGLRWINETRGKHKNITKY
jgi:hypothetical protein